MPALGWLLSFVPLGDCSHAADAGCGRFELRFRLLKPDLEVGLIELDEQIALVDELVGSYVDLFTYADTFGLTWVMSPSMKASSVDSYCRA